MNSTSDFERVIHEPDTNESDGHGEAVKVGANMIMTGVVMTFDHWGAVEQAITTRFECGTGSRSRFGQVHDRKQVRDRQL